MPSSQALRQAQVPFILVGGTVYAGHPSDDASHLPDLVGQVAQAGHLDPELAVGVSSYLKGGAPPPGLQLVGRYSMVTGRVAGYGPFNTRENEELVRATLREQFGASWKTASGSYEDFVRRGPPGFEAPGVGSLWLYDVSYRAGERDWQPIKITGHGDVDSAFGYSNPGYAFDYLLPYNLLGKPLRSDAFTEDDWSDVMQEGRLRPYEGSVTAAAEYPELYTEEARAWAPEVGSRWQQTEPSRPGEDLPPPFTVVKSDPAGPFDAPGRTTVAYEDGTTNTFGTGWFLWHAQTGLYAPYEGGGDYDGWEPEPGSTWTWEPRAGQQESLRAFRVDETVDGTVHWKYLLPHDGSPGLPGYGGAEWFEDAVRRGILKEAASVYEMRRAVERLTQRLQAADEAARQAILRDIERLESLIEGKRERRLRQQSGAPSRSFRSVTRPTARGKCPNCPNRRTLYRAADDGHHGDNPIPEEGLCRDCLTTHFDSTSWPSAPEASRSQAPTQDSWRAAPSTPEEASIWTTPRGEDPLELTTQAAAQWPPEEGSAWEWRAPVGGGAFRARYNAGLDHVEPEWLLPTPSHSTNNWGRGSWEHFVAHGWLVPHQELAAQAGMYDSLDPSPGDLWLWSGEPYRVVRVEADGVFAEPLLPDPELDAAHDLEGRAQFVLRRVWREAVLDGTLRRKASLSPEAEQAAVASGSCPRCHGRLEWDSAPRFRDDAVVYCPRCGWEPTATVMARLADRRVHDGDWPDLPAVGSTFVWHNRALAEPLPFRVTETFPEGTVMAECLTPGPWRDAGERPFSPGVWRDFVNSGEVEVTGRTAAHTLDEAPEPGSLWLIESDDGDVPVRVTGLESAGTHYRVTYENLLPHHPDDAPYDMNLRHWLNSVDQGWITRTGSLDDGIEPPAVGSSWLYYTFLGNGTTGDVPVRVTGSDAHMVQFEPLVPANVPNGGLLPLWRWHRNVLDGRIRTASGDPGDDPDYEPTEEDWAALDEESWDKGEDVKEYDQDEGYDKRRWWEYVSIAMKHPPAPGDVWLWQGFPVRVVSVEPSTWPAPEVGDAEPDEEMRAADRDILVQPLLPGSGFGEDSETGEFLTDMFEWGRTLSDRDLVRHVTSKAVDHSDGSMVAAFPDDPESLAVEGGQPADSLHVTLLLLDKEGQSPERLREIAEHLTQEMTMGGPSGTITGVMEFPEGEDGAPLVAVPSCKGLAELRDRVRELLGEIDVEDDSDYGWVPHITLGYDMGDRLDEIKEKLVGRPVSFSKVTVVEGGDEEDVMLKAASSADEAFRLWDSYQEQLGQDPREPDVGSLWIFHDMGRDVPIRVTDNYMSGAFPFVEFESLTPNERLPASAREGITPGKGFLALWRWTDNVQQGRIRSYVGGEAREAAYAPAPEVGSTWLFRVDLGGPVLDFPFRVAEVRPRTTGGVSKWDMVPEYLVPTAAYRAMLPAEITEQHWDHYARNRMVREASGGEAPPDVGSAWLLYEESGDSPGWAPVRVTGTDNWPLADFEYLLPEYRQHRRNVRGQLNVHWPSAVGRGILRPHGVTSSAREPGSLWEWRRNRDGEPVSIMRYVGEGWIDRDGGYVPAVEFEHLLPSTKGGDNLAPGEVTSWPTVAWERRIERGELRPREAARALRPAGEGPPDVGEVYAIELTDGENALRVTDVYNWEEYGGGTVETETLMPDPDMAPGTPWPFEQADWEEMEAGGQVYKLGADESLMPEEGSAWYYHDSDYSVNWPFRVRRVIAHPANGWEVVPTWLLPMGEEAMYMAPRVFPARTWLTYREAGVVVPHDESTPPGPTGYAPEPGEVWRILDNDGQTPDGSERMTVLGPEQGYPPVGDTVWVKFFPEDSGREDDFLDLALDTWAGWVQTGKLVRVSSGGGLRPEPGSRWVWSPSTARSEEFGAMFPMKDIPIEVLGESAFIPGEVGLRFLLPLNGESRPFADTYSWPLQSWVAYERSGELTRASKVGVAPGERWVINDGGEWSAQWSEVGSGDVPVEVTGVDGGRVRYRRIRVTPRWIDETEGSTDEALWDEAEGDGRARRVGGMTGWKWGDELTPPEVGSVWDVHWGGAGAGKPGSWHRAEVVAVLPPQAPHGEWGGSPGAVHFVYDGAGGEHPGVQSRLLDSWDEGVRDGSLRPAGAQSAEFEGAPAVGSLWVMNPGEEWQKPVRVTYISPGGVVNFESLMPNEGGGRLGLGHWPEMAVPYDPGAPLQSGGGGPVSRDGALGRAGRALRGLAGRWRLRVQDAPPDRGRAARGEVHDGGHGERTGRGHRGGLHAHGDERVRPPRASAPGAEADAWRLFIAFDPPEETVQQIVQWQRENLPAGAYPQRPENMHMTLAFLGDTPSERVPELLDIVSRLDASSVTLSGPVRYEIIGSRRQGVLTWAEDGGSAVWSELNAYLHEFNGYTPQYEPWLPHTTVWAFKEGADQSAQPRLPQIAPWSPTRVGLYRSQKDPRGGGMFTLVSARGDGQVGRTYVVHKALLGGERIRPQAPGDDVPIRVFGGDEDNVWFEILVPQGVYTERTADDFMPWGEWDYGVENGMIREAGTLESSHGSRADLAGTRGDAVEDVPHQDPVAVQGGAGLQRRRGREATPPPADGAAPGAGPVGQGVGRGAGSEDGVGEEGHHADRQAQGARADRARADLGPRPGRGRAGGRPAGGHAGEGGRRLPGVAAPGAVREQVGRDGGHAAPDGAEGPPSAGLPGLDGVRAGRDGGALDDDGRPGLGVHPRALPAPRDSRGGHGVLGLDSLPPARHGAPEQGQDDGQESVRRPVREAGLSGGHGEAVQAVAVQGAGVRGAARGRWRLAGRAGAGEPAPGRGDPRPAPGQGGGGRDGLHWPPRQGPPRRGGASDPAGGGQHERDGLQQGLLGGGGGAVDVVGSVFSGPGRPGDFSWMIEQPEYADSLFVFNDNQEQFMSGSTEAGGGNAAIRPYRGTRAAGVPTGTLGGGGYPSLTPEVRAVVDAGLAEVGDTLARGGFRRLFYSDDGSGSLGTGIFRVGDDVRDYIVRGLRSFGTGRTASAVGDVVRKGGSEWRVVSIEGDRVVVENVQHGFTREWTLADLRLPEVDHDPYEGPLLGDEDY